MEFFNAVLEFEFLRHALVAGALAGIACGVVGSYVVVRRITYIAGAIAHSVLAGLGVAHWLQVVHGWPIQPAYGAVVAAVVAALVIGIVVWAIGMAIGILFIAITPGYHEDLMSYLFGNILLIGGGDLWTMAALDAVVLLLALGLYPQLEAVCFDEEFARLRGLNVELYVLVLLVLTALTVVLLVSVVGIVLVIALLTLPAAIAGQFTTTLRGMMVVASFLAVFFTTAGLAVSYAPDLPAGATTIVIAGAAYLLVLFLRRIVAGFRSR
jgi:zinc transport system permease protein